jgi:integrase/recombinase XerD
VKAKPEFCGLIIAIPRRHSGALAQCAFCKWLRFFPNVARASVSLHDHAGKTHPDKLCASVRNPLGERISAGMKQAGLRGVKIGRPRLEIDLGKFSELAIRGRSAAQIAQALHCSKTYAGKKLKVLLPIAPIEPRRKLSVWGSGAEIFHNVRSKMILWRRHKAGCTAAEQCQCRKEQKRECHCCRCPIWADAYFGSSRIRKSLDTGDWSKAQRGAMQLESSWVENGSIRPEPKPLSIKEACDDFLENARARGLKDSTRYKYRLLLLAREKTVESKPEARTRPRSPSLQEFAGDNGLRFLRELDLPMLRKFRATWSNENFSAQKKLEALRTFFRFAQVNGWVAENVAAKLESHKTRHPQVLPFTREEMVRILAACYSYGDNYGRTGQENARRLRALVLLLRYSGLRIGDAVSLERKRIAEGKVFLYTAKTGTPVWCPLREDVIQALELVSGTHEKYFFWTGEGKLKSAVGDWQRSLKKLFALAKVPAGHPHRFRHTFAVELLLAGVPIERVSVLLGHSSTRITEKHYSAWVLARQEQLEADVRQSWALESPGAAVLLDSQRGSGRKN